MGERPKEAVVKTGNSQARNCQYCGEESVSAFISLPGIFVNWSLFLPQKWLARDVPKTFDDQREFDPSVLTADPHQAQDNPDSTSQLSEGSSDPSMAPVDGVSMALETSANMDSDPFTSYFLDWDPSTPTQSPSHNLIKSYKSDVQLL